MVITPTPFERGEPLDHAERGRRMAEALRRLGERNAFPPIEDPSAWQSEIRRDRLLPGRDD